MKMKFLGYRKEVIRPLNDTKYGTDNMTLTPTLT